MKKIQVHGVAEEVKFPLEYIIGPSIIKKGEGEIILVVKLDRVFTNPQKNKKIYKEDAEKLAELFETYLPLGTLEKLIKILYEDYMRTIHIFCPNLRNRRKR